MSPSDAARPARRYPRLDVHAFVVLAVAEVRITASVRNMSSNGALLSLDEPHAALMTVGSVHELIIFDPEVAESALNLNGSVVRHDGLGVAVTWNSDATAVAGAACFLERLYSKR